LTFGGLIFNLFAKTLTQVEIWRSRRFYVSRSICWLFQQTSLAGQVWPRSCLYKSRTGRGTTFRPAVATSNLALTEDVNVGTEEILDQPTVCSEKGSHRHTRSRVQSSGPSGCSACSADWCPGRRQNQHSSWCANQHPGWRAHEHSGRCAQHQLMLRTN
jgi:hypothetical protein